VPDARVQAAIDHWAPRFVQAGVDPNEFATTTSGIERWEDWLDTWARVAGAHAGRAREAETAGRRISAGDAWLRAAVAYHFGKFVWVVDPDRSRAVADEAVQALYAAHRNLDPTAERIEAPMGGHRVVGNLRRPAVADHPPLVLLIPGLDSTKEEFFRLEEVFLRRGMATLSIDGPGQGETGFDVPIRPDYEIGVTAILDMLDGREDLDLDRIGALGVSLGGYYAPRAAAFEPRLKAVVGLSGPVNFGETWDDLPELTRETFVHKSGAADAEDGRRRASELELDGVLQGLRTPALFVTGERDRLIPAAQTRRQAELAPHGRYVGFPDGNHGCANIPWLARPLLADWLAEHLG
jgi:pimeloyl-ACP methyl ester carboxylesterase